MQEKIMRRAAFLLIGWVLLVSSTGAATYYVATNGDNGNAGSEEYPWRDPVYGVGRLQAGDTLIIKTGTYYLPDQWDGYIEMKSGITVVGEDAVIAGTANQWAGVSFSGVSNARLEGLEVTNENIAGGDIRRGIDAVSSSGIQIVGCDLHHLRSEGIKFWNCQDILIEECSLRYNGSDGYGSGIDTEQVGVNGLTVRDCSLDYNTGDGIGLEASGGDIIIEDCTAIGNQRDGFDSKAPNSTVRRCVALNNTYNQIKLWADNALIENCIAASTLPDRGYWDAVFFVGSAGESYSIVNSVIYGSQNYGMAVGYDHPGSVFYVTIYNCIAAANHGPVYITASAVVEEDNNIFLESDNGAALEMLGRTYTAAQINAGEAGPNDMSVDPLFVDASNADFHLQQASPGVDAGRVIASVSDDLEKNPRPMGDGYDIGAYEYSPYPPGGDEDGDGLLNSEEDLDMDGELEAGETNANDPDTDGDGISDMIELLCADLVTALNPGLVPSQMRFSFQPAGSGRPAGFVADGGSNYSQSKGFGWE